MPYPFEKLAALKNGIVPPAELSPISLSIGEPRHAPPDFIFDTLAANRDRFSTYPKAAGLAEFRRSAAGWLTRRYGLPDGMLNPDTQVLPVNGTREALFAFVQAAVDPAGDPLVLMPNPCYQIYEGGALLAGAEPGYLDTTAGTGFLPDLDRVDPRDWDRCQLLFLCSPGNPTGAVMSLDYLERAIELADRHDFLIAADECYADIYLHDAEPPPGLLQACARIGRTGAERCIVFHSLSKRSNVPGMRSGFVAGDEKAMAAYRLYRTYHGCAVPEAVQLASIPAWDDEAHVLANRRQYQAKFAAVVPILEPVLDVFAPPASFYVWAGVPGSDEDFARDLFASQNVTVLPGSYLSRPGPDGDPGAGRVRISLVAELDVCVDAAQRIARFLEHSS
jgi:N-succinyldiaminopimelate aminotransferase